MAGSKAEDGFAVACKEGKVPGGCLSYSCANALPFFAQADGLAKIIGQQPGGGDCLVAPFLDAYGHVARMSGWNKFGRMSDGKFVSDEKSVNVDYPFGDEADKLYFNYERIAQWLKEK